MILVRVAGTTVGVSASDSTRVSVREGAADFVVSSGTPEVELVAGVGPGEGRRAGEILFDAFPTWQLFGDDAGCTYRFLGAGGERAYREASFDRTFSRCRVSYLKEAESPPEVIYPFEAPVDQLLIMNVLSSQGGALLHALGVATAEGDGLVFVGNSGDGKSTMARVWDSVPGAEVLNDDRIALRHEGGRFRIYGTPWHGEFEKVSARDLPLRAVFVLRKARSCRVTPVGGAAAVAALVARSFVPYHDREAIGRVAALFGRLAAEVPVYDFEFTPDLAAVEAARSAVAND